MTTFIFVSPAQQPVKRKGYANFVFGVRSNTEIGFFVIDPVGEAFINLSRVEKQHNLSVLINKL